MDKRICPYCKEGVKNTATICKHCRSSLPPPLPQKKRDQTWGIFFGLLILLLWFCQDSRPPPEVSTISPEKETNKISVSKRYPGPWVDEIDIEISRVLFKNNVLDCGEYKFKSSSQNTNEYLVKCTHDGINWIFYIVWVGIDKIINTDEYGVD